MKNIVFFLMLILIGCKTTNNDIDYCKMLFEDQSFLSKQERSKRIKIFEKNFEIIINETIENGFPKVNAIGIPPIDSCKYWAVNGTLIHISQTKPELFYSNETIEIFENQIIKGNLTSNHLYPAVKLGSGNALCLSLKNEVTDALERWNLDINVFQNLRFEECNN